MTTADSVPAGSGGASMLTKPLGQVWKHLVRSLYLVRSAIVIFPFEDSPVDDPPLFCGGSLTDLNIISSAFCVTVRSPAVASMDRTALLTPSAATSRSYGSDTVDSSP